MAKKSNSKKPETSKKSEVYRSAETGRFVSKKFADKNPNTTIKHTRTGGPKSRG